MDIDIKIITSDYEFALDLIESKRFPERRHIICPGEATITLVYFIYEAGFRNFKMGYASAASWILFVIVAVATILYFRTQNRWVHYQ